MRNYILLLVAVMISTTVSFAQNDKIIINKKPRTTTTNTQNKKTNPYPNNSKNTIPSKPSSTSTQQNRVQHQNTQKLGYVELRYSVTDLGQTAKHNHYRIIGHIYSDLNEPIFCHNRRIAMFQIDNWDAGFLNDNLQSVDGYATQYRLNPSGNLFQFGNSAVREFAFDFKVKKGLKHRVRSEIIKDWAPLKDYEQYLLLEYSMLNGSWNMESNAEAKFDIQFSTQGDQLVMKDIFGTPISWTKGEGNTYVRKIGNAPTPTQQQAPQQQQPSQDSNSSSNYPSGGYLGNGNSNSNNSNSNTNNQNKTNTNSGSNYPSGGYLGDGNSNNNQGNANNNNTNAETGAYSSVIEIVDRSTIRYRNSEGIVCLLKKSTTN